MAVPKQKISKSRRGQRRSHDALKVVNIIYNKETGEAQLPHQVSLDGYYGRKQVITEKVKAEESQKEEAPATTKEENN